MKGLYLLCLLPIGICGVLLGGYSSGSVNRETEKLAKDALEKFNAASDGITKTYSKLLAVQTQVVAGINYKFTIEVTNGNNEAEICKLVLWMPLSGPSQLTSNECREKPKKPNLFGDVDEVSPSDLAVIKAVNFAMDDLNARSNSLYRLSAEKIVRAQKRVVEGTLYKLTVSVGESVCRNSGENSGKDLNECPLGDSGMKQTCNFEVIDKEWLKQPFSLLSSSCKQNDLIGGDGHDLCHGGHFSEFKQNFGRVYENLDEEKKRFSIFCDNMKKARQLQESERGTAVYGATKFADMTEEEFKQYVGKPWDQITQYATNMKTAIIPKGEIPTAFDWRDHGVVTPVKNQGSCGSCWAFSVTGNIEGQWALKKKHLYSLSEQELVDCDKLDDGCEGGLPSNAFESIMKLGGLETEKDYAYRGRDEKCFFNRSEVVVDITGSVNISSNEKDMAAWLYQNGPISIGINANAMQFYMGGISHPWKIFCNPKHLDHGVLIVGYGVKGSEPYWIIKNSWGPDWGEKGYYLAYRGGGVCGLNTMCTSATV